MDTTRSLEEVYESVEKPLTADEYMSKHGLDVDVVNHPSHYTSGKIECINYIEDALTPEEFRGYLRGCMIKYQHRLMHKGSAKQNAEKMRWYNDKLIGIL